MSDSSDLSLSGEFMDAAMNRSKPRVRIAFIGSAGIPNRYGGFESFVEHCAPLMVREGHEVLVTCDRRLYPDEPEAFQGVQRVFVGIPANGALSPLHDFWAFLRVLWRADVFFVLGVSAGPFFPVMRLLAALSGKRLAVNIDGVEWRRGKYTWMSRLILWGFDFLAQLSATDIIYDNKALLTYVHAPFRRKAYLIAYPGDHVLRFPGLHDLSRHHALTICRIEPENHVDLLIEGALASSIRGYTIIGNWDKSEYGRNLRRKHMRDPRLALLDPIYELVELGRHREACSVYLHGHSVGGTNPSLIEMLFYDCSILCFDCVFNRETAKNRALYFVDAHDLAMKINQALDSPQSAPATGTLEYTARHIVGEYLRVALGRGSAKPE